MPAWIPGSYMIRDFSKNIVSLCAASDNCEVKITQLDKQQWITEPVSGSLSIMYQVYAWDLSVRAAHLDQTHGYFNGSSVFLAVEGAEDADCTLLISPPDGVRYKNWQIATTLSTKGAQPHQFGLYGAANYEELIDHPVEMGEFTLASFAVEGIPHEISITGRHETDTERLCKDLEMICTRQAQLFGDLPIDNYLFQVMAVGDGYGGLEHRKSTSLICKRSDLPSVRDQGVTEGYRSFLGLCSHEYFHLWNVKRIRPQKFFENDLSSEVYTRLLWAFEGITSYYDDLILVRSAVIEPASYLELLAQKITRYIRGSGRFKQSLEQSSFEAWTKFYKQDENAPNAIVSYYTKGALVALSLDLRIRLDSDGKYSLDDLVLGLWRDYGRRNIGVPEEGIEKMAHKVTDLDLTDFFDRYIRGTEDPPLAELLQEFAVEMRLRSAVDSNDKGGLFKQEFTENQAVSVLGIKLSPQGNEARVCHVFDQGAAQLAGISAGDTIIAVNGLQVSRDNLENRIAMLPAGETIAVHLFRRDELMLFDVVLQQAPDDTCFLELLSNDRVDRIARRCEWLEIQHG